jgi:hypothetical protein
LLPACKHLRSLPERLLAIQHFWATTVRILLALLKIRFGNAGNDVIEKIPIAVYFQSGAHIIDARLASNLREYEKGIQCNTDKNFCCLEVSFINPGKSQGKRTSNAVDS